MDKNSIDHFLRSRGRPMSEINPGSHEYALTLQDAKQLISLLPGSTVPLLGGDVVAESEGRLRYTYENWYIVREPAEDDESHARRSYRKAEDFISSLEARAAPKTYVVFVFDD
jgi:hypothetical protein